MLQGEKLSETAAGIPAGRHSRPIASHPSVTPCEGLSSAFGYVWCISMIRMKVQLACIPERTRTDRFLARDDPMQ